MSANPIAFSWSDSNSQGTIVDHSRRVPPEQQTIIEITHTDNSIKSFAKTFIINGAPGLKYSSQLFAFTEYGGFASDEIYYYDGGNYATRDEIPLTIRAIRIYPMEARVVSLANALPKDIIPGIQKIILSYLSVSSSPRSHDLNPPHPPPPSE